jgi:hypothetical protein
MSSLINDIAVVFRLNVTFDLIIIVTWKNVNLFGGSVFQVK